MAHEKEITMALANVAIAAMQLDLRVALCKMYQIQLDLEPQLILDSLNMLKTAQASLQNAHDFMQQLTPNYENIIKFKKPP